MSGERSIGAPGRWDPQWSRAIRVVVWSFLFWTGLGVFFASQLYFAGMPWRQALEWSLPRWYSWALLTPAIFRLDRRWVTLALPARIGLHLPLGVAWTSLAILTRLAARPLRGAPIPADLRAFFLERFYPDMLIYTAIAVVSMVRAYTLHMRQREQQAQARAADLERRLVEARLQALRAQLQPHFLFNALNTISAFTETDPRTARRLMGQLGDLLRASLTHAAQPLVTLGEELTFLDDYLAIESARFEGRLAVSVQADDEIMDVKVPGFLLQPLVENAIRHGVGPRLSGGHIEVTAVRDGTHLRLGVRDDGVGLPAGWTLDGHAGVGLRNVASRIEHLYGGAARLQLGAGPRGGVDVQVTLPIQPPAAPDVIAAGA